MTNLQEEQAWFPSHSYSIAGTWSNFSPLAMHWDGHCFVHCMRVSKKGWESFQILQGGRWDLTVYPSIRDANPFERYKLRGPDGNGTGRNWTMGQPPRGTCSERNAVRAGQHYRICVEVDGSSHVNKVTWAVLTETPEASRALLGPRRVLVLRHGSRPESSTDPMLDLLGFSQATHAARYLGREATRLGIAPVTAIFSSPFLRALQTAAPAAKALGLRICVEEGFCELLAHQWLHTQDPLPSLGAHREGLPPASLLDDDYKSIVAPSYPDVVGRLRKDDEGKREKPTKRHRRAIEAALSAACGGSVLIVGHGATHDFLAQALCPKQHPEQNRTPHCVQHCGITEIHEQDGDWRLVAFGAAPWKEEAERLAAKAEAVELSAEQETELVKQESSAAPQAKAVDQTKEEPNLALGTRSEAGDDLQSRALQALDPPAPAWVVVGGHTSGGIVVRKGAGLHSKELIERLRAGARVLQLELRRERLHYQKLEGVGPDYGWVTIKHKDIVLLQREEEEEPN